MPGEASYIGEYYFYAETMGVLRFELMGDDVELAKKKLDAYKNVSSPLVAHAPMLAEYNCVKKRIGVIGSVCNMDTTFL